MNTGIKGRGYLPPNSKRERLMPRSAAGTEYASAAIFEDTSGFDQTGSYEYEILYAMNEICFPSF